MSNMPANIKEPRTKYKVMANMFLLAKMRQPSRQLYKDLEVNTFSDFLDELQSDRNFLMKSDDDDHLVIPPWNQCLNNEFNIRKDAVRRCMEEGFSIKDALWHTLSDNEHRMQHWILKLTIANALQDSSRVQKLEQRQSVLEKQRRRSRSPRRQQNQRSLPAPHKFCSPVSILGWCLSFSSSTVWTVYEMACFLCFPLLCTETATHSAFFAGFGVLQFIDKVVDVGDAVALWRLVKEFHIFSTCSRCLLGIWTLFP